MFLFRKPRSKPEFHERRVANLIANMAVCNDYRVSGGDGMSAVAVRMEAEIAAIDKSIADLERLKETLKDQIAQCDSTLFKPCSCESCSCEE